MSEHVQEEETDYVDLWITPIPPDTVATVKTEIRSVIRQILEENGQIQLWDGKEIRVSVESTLGLGEQLVVVGVTLLSGMALETYKAIVIPELKKRFKLQEKPRKKSKAKQIRR